LEIERVESFNPMHDDEEEPDDEEERRDKQNDRLDIEAAKRAGVIAEGEDQLPPGYAKEKVEEMKASMAGTQGLYNSWLDEDDDEDEEDEDEDDEDDGEEGDVAQEEEEEEEEDPPHALMPVAELKELFKALDMNKDKKVSLQEVVQYTRGKQIDFAKTTMKAILNASDENQDGRLSIKEALKYDVQHTNSSTADELKQLDIRNEAEKKRFELADADGNGVLTVDEMHLFMTPGASEAVLKSSVETTMLLRDKDGDGKLSIVEFWSEQLRTDATTTQGNDNPDEFDADLDDPSLKPKEPDDVTEEEMSDKQRRDFKRLDKNGDKLLDADEVAAWERGTFYLEKDMERMFEVCDRDESGHILLREFLATWRQIKQLDAKQVLFGWEYNASAHPQPKKKKVKKKEEL